MVAPVLTPQGHLVLADGDDAVALSPPLAERLTAAFGRGAGHGLLQLGAAEVGTPLPPALAYWRDFAERYVTAVCTHAESDARSRIAPPAHEELDRLVTAAPPMTGAEYLTPRVLDALWLALDEAFHAELADSGLAVEAFLKRRNPAWNLVGRVYFNLAENRRDEEAPFAFLATYTTQLTKHGKAKHVPLGEALHEYAGARKREQLLSLLMPVQRAAEKCPWLAQMVADGDVYHPLRWTPPEAFQLLNDTPLLESAGVIVRVPGAWKGMRPPRPRVRATVGGKPPSNLGADALLDFRMEVSLEGERLTANEIEQLLKGSDGLVLIRGRWVEIDREKLKRMLDEFRRIEDDAKRGGVSFAEAMRLIAGSEAADDGERELDREWSHVTAGAWLAETLAGLRGPEGLARVDPGPSLKTPLRPYQQVGLQWLYLLQRLRLGACLADDMGLGKTLQVLALLLVLREEDRRARRARTPSLLVAPASLLANWVAEIEKHAPALGVLVAHPSVTPASELKSLRLEALRERDLVITSYGSLTRYPWLHETEWRLAVLDEAQAIRNPGTQQTRAAKRLKAQVRLALTGTPIENRLGDLWSIFDFLNPGLLGSAQTFSLFVKRLAAREHESYAPLRELVRPYILRRLKTDKRVISDLPDKTEVQAFCGLTPKQAALYDSSVKALSAALEETREGVQRKGLILSYLMRFKQICNHPSQWLGDGLWTPSDSGKLERLREIAEVIGSRQEKVLVFTQFREAAEPLSHFLATVFGREGLVLHGGTAVRRRHDLVQRFQNDETVPYFVLSLKAGGSGLNLTAATHVVHFDRWWNPAVEDQATDRAYRIGQHRNVLVHKFVCRGTLEEKIDELLTSKRRISEDVLAGGAEAALTEMSDREILDLVSLDIKRAAV